MEIVLTGRNFSARKQEMGACDPVVGEGEGKVVKEAVRALKTLGYSAVFIETGLVS